MTAELKQLVASFSFDSTDVMRSLVQHDEPASGTTRRHGPPALNVA